MSHLKITKTSKLYHPLQTPQQPFEGHSLNCLICTETITYYAIGPCNHACCHLCALRLRVLYKTTSCPYCKSTIPSAIFTDNPKQLYQEQKLSSIPFRIEKYNLYMFSQEILKYIQNILEYNCPDSECTYKEPHSNMNQLKQHIQQSHKKQLCSVCVKNKKAFTHEMKMFSVPLLAKHMKEGDKDDLSFKGHPECGFCRVSYYGTDELYAHCREKHEQCFLCQGDKKLNLYFQNYAKLEMHYKSDHFICTYQVCLDKKFVVFRSDMDLKAHELSEHGKGQGKRGVQVEIDLTYNTQRQSAASDRQSMEEGQGEFISHRNHHRAIERNIDLTQSKGEIDKTDTSISSRKTNKTKSNQGNASLSTLHQSPSTSIEGIHPERLNISGHKTTREAFNTSQDINTQQYPQLSNSTRSLRVPLNFGSTLSDINTSNSGESIKKSIPSTSILKENKFKSKRETTSSIILNPPGLSHPLLPTSISITTDASLNELINVHFDSNSKKIEQFDSLFKSYSSELITSQEFLDGLVSMSNKDVQRVWIRLSAFIGGLNERDMLSAWNDLKAGSLGEDFSRIGKTPYTLNKIKSHKPAELPLNDVFKILTINRAHSTTGRTMKKGRSEIIDKRIDIHEELPENNKPEPIIKAAREYAEEKNPFEQDITLQLIPQKQTMSNQEMKGGKTRYSKMMGSSAGDIQPTVPSNPQTLNSDFPSLPWTQKLDMNKMYGKKNKVDEFDELFLDVDSGKKGKKGKKVLMKWG